MSRYFRVRTCHDTYLAIYQHSGALCATSARELNDKITPVFLLMANDFSNNIGVLFGSAPTAGFFVRPYAFGNKAIPLEIRHGIQPNTVSFIHPGTQFYIAVEPKRATDHFALVMADRDVCSTWESFVLEPVPHNELPASGQVFVDEFSTLFGTKKSLVDLYAQLGCDDLAPRPDVPSISALMKSFESLGDNCEFGCVQRRSGIEPLSLLRFGSGLGADGVAAALRERFVRLGQIENMECEERLRYIYDKSYNFSYHTWREEDNFDPEKILEEESKKLRYLRNKLIEDLENASKIFVFKKNDSLEEVSLLNLHSAIREFGDNTLLTVVEADPDHAPGTVVTITDGLLRGYIDRFAPYDRAFDISVPSWIRICRNAYAAVR